MMNCKNCNESFNGNYCSNCGQPLKLKRIDGHYISHEIEHVLHFERGILYTVKGLLISPGQNIRHFITDNRSRLVKPIIFIIVTSLIYTLVNHFYHIDEGYVKFSDTKISTTNTMFKWIQDHYGYSNILMGIFIALWTKIFFRKYNYNFYEILILLCFVIGMAMLIYTVFAIFLGLTNINLLKIGGYIGIIYCAWAIGQFFDGKKIFNYVKALASFVLGTATFYLLVLLTGTLIDLIITH
jgi:Protein of unknown function (DUF3667)